ncbi:MAG TPA: biotin/lipoyl-containing protein [Streptosporangiaceae bacterium]|nr:biotin/lipoyl-containing protein [Streptosporangiaceae bacterium]
MKEVRVPKVGMSTVEVEIDQVLVAPGQRVQPGSVIASVAADKVDFEVEAEVDGVVEEVLLTEGAVAEVGTVIARIRED